MYLCPKSVIPNSKHRFSSPLKVTIVTVVKNDSRNIAKTINSVIQQDFRNIEYIIVDALSSDGTTETINTFCDPRIIHVCENDSGLYDAMNKAIRLSTGDYIAFLNSGDTYLDDGTVSAVFAQAHSGLHYDIIYGHSILCSETCEQHVFQRAKDYNWLNLLIWSTRLVCHQSLFVSTSSIPLFNTSFVLKAELDWYYSLLSTHKRILRLDFPVSVYLLGGLSEKYFWTEILETIYVSFSRNGIAFLLTLPVIAYKIILRICPK
jgi:glycosyltransferase involved in cell wall biosynthesis